MQTAYLIAEIIVIPLSGWLTRVFSTRWLFAGSAFGFTVSSIMCGFAWSINSMIIFRAMQGLLGASMIPLVLTSAFIYFPGSKQVISAAIIGALSFLAPTLGPIIGGYITDAFNWHWLFYINLVPGTAISILAIKWIDIDKPDLTLLKGADYTGIILMAVGLGSLEYLLEEGARWNWFSDNTIVTCTWVSGISLTTFIVRSLMIKNPIMDFRALENRNFSLGCILSFIVGIGIFSSTYLTPLFLDYVRGFSAWQTGLALFPSGVSSLIGLPVYVVLARRYELRWILMTGLFAFALSMWSFTLMNSTWTGQNFFWPQVLRGLPLIFCVAPSVTLGLGSLSAERLKYASGLFNMMRNLGGAVGIAVSGTILNNRTNYHFSILTTNLAQSREPVARMVQSITQNLTLNFGSHLIGPQTALKLLWQITYIQAETLSYADAFRAIMLAFILAAAIVPFMQKT